MEPADPLYAVVGAAGFLGGAVVRNLEAEGVRCVSFTRASPFALPSGELHPDLIASDRIFWLVGSLRPAAVDPRNVSADLAAVTTLVDGLDRAGSAARIVAVSSGGTVYASEHLPPHSETTPTRAVNGYGQALLAVEHLLQDSWPNHTILRVSNAYGPGQPARRGQGVIAYWLHSVVTGQPVQIIGDPASKRDYVYIDDVADALVRAARRPHVPPVVNVGSGVGTALSALYELLVETVGHPIEVQYQPPRAFDAPSNWLDISLANVALGWRPQTSLRAGLTRAWRSVAATAAH